VTLQRDLFLFYLWGARTGRGKDKQLLWSAATLPTWACGKFFTQLACVGGVLMCLHGKLVSSEMISFVVGHCGSCVGMGGKVMKFRDFSMAALWHVSLLRVRGERGLTRFSK
jgi:hypothetical protein